MLTTKDRQQLKSLTPEMVERWLKANGWEPPGGSVLIFEIWTHPEHGMLNLHGLMIVPELKKKGTDLYHVVSTLEDLAKRIDRYPHEILAEMLQPGCVMETCMWFRFEDREPVLGQECYIKFRSKVISTLCFVCYPDGRKIWSGPNSSASCNPDDFWRPIWTR